MQIKKGPQGYLRKNLSGNLTYYSFVPTPLGELPQITLSENTRKLLNDCARHIGELEGMLRFVPNASMYLAMYVRKEALLSAQIEGTQCTFDDILNPSNTGLTQREVADVVAYVKATNYAVERMESLPLSSRLLKETHKVLLDKTRGSDKVPGETRTSQNWIGPAGCTLNEASFVPPNVEDMGVALSDLEHFIHGEQNIDPLVKAALIHYQFETIHPFLDGNGRMGRLLITLSLINEGILSSAIFYPSYQLKLRRNEYYENLTAVRVNGAYASWIEFFCECLLESATDAIQTLEQLVSLHEKTLTVITENLGRLAPNAQRLLELLEGNPLVGVNFVAERLGVGRTTASNLVKVFCNQSILVPVEEQKQRYRSYAYDEYLSILRQGGDPLR